VVFAAGQFLSGSVSMFPSMRVLHTSDWHLGKRLAGISREAEHQHFLNEVVELVTAESIDLVLLSGDVFDVYNPPITAEEQFFDTLARLGDRGRRAVIVIAGNHDSPDRLAASAPLAAQHGVFLFGHPGDVVPTPRARPGRVQVAHTGPSELTLGLPNGQSAAICALPYPSESRLKALLATAPREEDRRRAWVAAMRSAFAQTTRHFSPQTVNLITTHVFVDECTESESERTLVGGAYRMPASVFPGSAQYVALGHLHTPQDVVEGRVRYAGSPLRFRMSERDNRPSHTIVDVVAGRPASVSTIDISAGRPLIRWEVDGLDELVRRVADGEHAQALIELRLGCDRPLTHGQVATLKKLPRDFVKIRAVLPSEQDEAETPFAERQDIHELFRAFYRSQRESQPPDGLVELFVELAGDDPPEAIA
jgi:DNA repair protein SbcD/Mre11